MSRLTEADLAPGQNVERLLCSICSELFQDPVFPEGKCQCVFCKDCITENLKARIECPLCQTKLNGAVLKAHRWVQNALDDLQVVCPFNCSWKGTVQARSSHLASCPVAQVNQELEKVEEELQATEQRRTDLQKQLANLDQDKFRLEGRRARLLEEKELKAADEDSLAPEALKVEWKRLEQERAELKKVAEANQREEQRLAKERAEIEEARKSSGNRLRISLDDLQWHYRTPRGKLEGPFGNQQMKSWLKTGYVTLDLPVRISQFREFYPLGSLFAQTHARCFNELPHIPPEETELYGVIPNATGAAHNCTGRHGLRQYFTQHDRFHCDICGSTVVRGTMMWSCRPCNHDVCQGCASKDGVVLAAV